MTLSFFMQCHLIVFYRPYLFDIVALKLNLSLNFVQTFSNQVGKTCL